MRLREVTGVMRVTDMMRKNAVGQKTQIYALIPPMDFLELTTKYPGEIDQIKANAQSILKYNRWAKKDEIVVHPFLRIDIMPLGIAKVRAHEGRHRAAAMLATNAPYMPVAIQLRTGVNSSGEEYEPKMSSPDGIYYNSEYRLTSEDLPMTIIGQFDGIAHSRRNWKIVQDDALSRFRRD